MTIEEACAEAQKRWGKYGCAEWNLLSPRGPYSVGTWETKERTYIYGLGKSWEAAFNDASWRERVS